MKPRKHAAIIKAWADGAKIQYCTSTGEWVEISKPSWHKDTVYRIKPDPNPEHKSALQSKARGK